VFERDPLGEAEVDPDHDDQDHHDREAHRVRPVELDDRNFVAAAPEAFAAHLLYPQRLERRGLNTFRRRGRLARREFAAGSTTLLAGALPITACRHVGGRCRLRRPAPDPAR
jgi:hypothetical protein